MTVLVTGAAGFLGSYTVAALEAAGHAARGFDMAPPPPEALAVAPSLRHGLDRGQVTDAARLMEVCRQGRIGCIVHTAGLVGFEASLEQPFAAYQTNVMGFVAVCEAARQSGVRRVVLVSSNAAYHAGAGPCLSEEDAVFSTRHGNPAGHYGASKMMQEAVALTYATAHGLDVIVLRVTAIYGFGMRAPMYIKPMVENAVRGVPSVFATGGPMKRDYTYVLDCASAIALAVGAPPDAGRPKVLNVSAGRVSTAAEVADVVRDQVAGADIRIGDGLTPLEAENVKMRAPLDISAARAALGWTPRWTLAEGVADYAARYRRFLAA